MLSLQTGNILQPRKLVHDLHCFHADGYHAQEQVEDVPRLALFCGPVVGVVGDAAGLVRFDLVAFHDPFHGGSTIDHIVIGCLRDMRNGYPRVILDGRLVLLVREAHLLHAELALLRAADDHVRVRGLMTIPPADADREANLGYFREVRALYVDMNEKLFHNELEYLSMGMSGDYADAIREGATMVRVGTAIFGARHYL